jgi:hypothetical protein
MTSSWGKEIRKEYKCEVPRLEQHITMKVLVLLATVALASGQYTAHVATGQAKEYWWDI